MHIVWCLGGLGNQMFQYAFYKSIEMSGYAVSLDINEFKGYSLHNGFELEDVFGIRPKISEENECSKFKSNKIQNLFAKFGISKTVHIQKYFGYEELDLSRPKYWKGYWQSEKFFYNARESIRSDFTFKSHTHETEKLSNSIKNCDSSISVHVRRGDYLDNKLLGEICTKDYYQNAVNCISKHIKNPHYFVFSDDIDWCKRELLFNNATYITNQNPKNNFRDMQLMSECRHNIIANSSFSWWGAWLNGNDQKIVISPRRWFNDKRFFTGDIHPDGWIKI